MIERLILAFLLVIYAAGCAATAVELYHQMAEEAAPSGVELARRHPAVNIFATASMVALWPIAITWLKVREFWR
jgi:hypothetical protein